DRSPRRLATPERRGRRRADQRGGAPLVQRRDRRRQGRARRRKDLDRELGHRPPSTIALSLWIETQTVPLHEAASVGAWPTGTTPLTRPSCGSISMTVPSALLAANT